MPLKMRHDEGFSLTELLVVMALLGMVMMVTYSALQLTFRANENQERDAYVSSAIVEPLQVMSVVISQNTQIDAGSGDYILSCVTDADANDVAERHIFQAFADGRLVESVYNVSSAGANTTLRRQTVWQRVTTNPPSRNVNVLKSKPVFSYWAMDTAGSMVPTSPMTANGVNVYIESRYRGQDYTDSRRVMFRNR